MHNDVIKDATAAVAKNRRKSIWKRIVSVLACIVVFCTTYALILPALTLERAPECGMEEHTHTEACYIKDETNAKQELMCDVQTLGLHQHADACFDIDGRCIFGYSDFVLHSHNEFCFDENGVLVCTLPEISAHIHTDDCYIMSDPATDFSGEADGFFDNPVDGNIDSSLDAGLGNMPIDILGHIHTDDCYVTERGELICTLPEEPVHAHTDECYLNTNNLICSLTEGEGHTHTPECYQSSSTLICTIGEGSQAHVHTDECYVMNEVLACGMQDEQSAAGDGSALPFPENEGWPTEISPENDIYNVDGATDDKGEPVCGIPEIIPHCHDASCFDASGAVICGMPEVLEHIHTQDCMGILDDSDELTCTIAEGDGAHFHTVEDGCFDEEGNLVCVLEESEGHVHGTICYGNWTLICEIEEHTHTDECYPSDEPEADPARETFCGKEEHTHEGECIDANGVVVCEIEEHAHTEECYVNPFAEREVFCGKTEHKHADECVDANGVISCGIEEHSHIEECYVDPAAELETFCGKEEHVHAAECFDENGMLICVLEEHLHGEECYVNQMLNDVVARIYVSATAENSIMLMSVNDGIAPYADTPLDFGPSIDGVTLQYFENGQWKPVYEGYKVKNGENVRFNIEYELAQGILNGNGVIEYKLPDAIKVINDQSGPVLDGSNKDAGTYTINKDGLITIFIDKTHVQNNESSTIKGFINAEGTIDSSKADEGSKIVFGNNITIDTPITILPPDNSDVSVTKSSSGEIDEKNGTITYTVTVSSQNGTTDSVVVTDTITTIPYQSMTLSEVFVDGTKIQTPATSENENGEKAFSHTFDKMTPGSSHEIKYTYKLPDGYKDSTVDIKVDNTVKATTKKNDDTPVESNEGKVTVTHKQDYLGKSGAMNGDGNITWTVTINEGGHNIGGLSFVDKLNGGDLPDTAFPLVLQASDGNNITINSKDALKSFTFPNSCNTTYTITYVTPAVPAPGTNQVNNEVELDDKNPSTTNPKVNYPVAVDKTFEPVTKTALSLEPDLANDIAIVRWKVKIAATDGPIAAPWTFTDTLRRNWDGNSFITDKQFEQLKDAIDQVAKKYKYKIEPIPAADYDPTIVGFKIIFETPMEMNDSLEFQFSSTGNLDGGKDKRIFGNTGKVNDNGGDYDEKVYEHIEAIKKYDRRKENEQITTHDYQDIDEGLLQWVVYITPPETCNGDMVVTDYLPKGVNFVSTKIDTEGSYLATQEITGDGLYAIPHWGAQYQIGVKIVDNKVTFTIPKNFVEEQYSNHNKGRFKISIDAKVMDNYPFVKDTNNIPSAEFANKVEVGDSSGTFDKAEQTQIVTKMPLRKNDNRDKNKESTVHDYEQINNGELQWEILVTPPDDFTGDKFEIYEQLPPNVSVTLCKLVSSNGFGEQTMNADGNYTFGKGAQSFTVNKTSHNLPEGQKLTISIPNEFIKERVTFKLYVNAKIDEDCVFTQDPNNADKLVAQFNNVVSTNAGVKVNQNQTINKKPTKILTKAIGTIDYKTNKVPYTLTINPDGVDLLENSDELTLTDVLRFASSAHATAELVGDSLKVYKINANGEEELLDTPYQLVYSQDKIGQGNQEEVYTISMKVPDATPLRVEYTYIFKCKIVGQWIGLSNSANLEGDTQNPQGTGVNNGFNISDSSAGLTSGSLTIEKVELGNDGKKLQGAEFELYKYQKNETTNEYSYVKVEVDSKGNKLKLISDADGKVIFSDIEQNVAYYYKEVKAPDGYICSGEERYFYIRGEGDLIAPAGFTGTGYQEGQVIRFRNESATISIKLQKKWQNTKNQPYEPTVDRITATLKCKAYEKGTNTLVGEVNLTDLELPAGFNNTIEITAAGNWQTAAITGLPKYGTVNGKEVYYAYYVVENNTNPDITPTYSDNQAGITTGTITITNTVDTTPKHELPQTGGSGTAPAMILGGGVMAITLILALIKSAGYKKRGKEDFSSS